MTAEDFPLFKALNPTQLGNFVAACETAQIPAGQTFIEQAGSGDRLYFLLEGTVRVFVTRPNGEPRDLVTISAPAVIGEMEALTGEQRAASVRAETDVAGLALPFATFHARIADGDPATLKVVHQMSRVLARRLAAMDHKLAELELQSDVVRIGDLHAFQQKLLDEWTV